eukprot:2751867-Prymnesium_polylepis.2
MGSRRACSTPRCSSGCPGSTMLPVRWVVQGVVQTGARIEGMIGSEAHAQVVMVGAEHEEPLLAHVRVRPNHLHAKGRVAHLVACVPSVDQISGGPAAPLPRCRQPVICWGQWRWRRWRWRRWR